MRRILAFSALMLLTSLPVAAIQGIASSSVSGSSVSLTVALPGNLGADVTLSFESVTGLTLANLGVSAQLINPSDPTLLARLPGGSIPAGAFPVLLRIEPPATGNLAFTGIATLEIHTHNLQYVGGSPLRIFSAPIGGGFHDITADMGAGSYRARGTSGGFSEFLIVSEARSLATVIAAKFNRLEALLDGYEGSMSATLYDDLSAILGTALAEYTQGDTSGAIHEIDDFLELVEDNSGTALPDVWRSARNVENVAGYLRARAQTLRFSLVLQRAGGV
ncbi:MAG TPA: DUF6689 family protein [Thermoanaerobaculia bacterium]|nr:DUF6689 family protein [Thermoanaerobaculia bacterium]